MSATIYRSRPVLTLKNQDFQFNSMQVRKVTRRLFGPVDPQATQKFIDDEMNKNIVNKSERWNFDFKTETTLNPNGILEWRPATPKKQVRLIKRPVDTEVDNSNLYCGVAEEEVIKPRPVKVASPSPNFEKTQQSRITDFMKATKRPSSTAENSRKQPTSDWNPDIPHKIPRLDIAS